MASDLDTQSRILSLLRERKKDFQQRRLRWMEEQNLMRMRVKVVKQGAQVETVVLPTPFEAMRVYVETIQTEMTERVNGERRARWKILHARAQDLGYGGLEVAPLLEELA